MKAEYIEFIVEEPSAEAFLHALLGRMVNTVSYSIHAFRCKNELLQRLPDRLRGYSQWLPDNHRIVVLVDRDDDDCNALKTRLEEYAAHAGLATRTHQSRNQFSVVNRILVEELEAWYFGDWEAVRAAYPGVSATIPRKSKFRDPDGIRGGTWEAFERVLQRAGHFRNGLRKIEAAREIAARMDPMRNSSPSFQVFRDAVLELDTGA